MGSLVRYLWNAMAAPCMYQEGIIWAGSMAIHRDVLQIMADLEMTVVLITHEPDIAAHATRVVYVRDGLIWRDEKIVQTRARPGKPAGEAEPAIAFPFTIVPALEEVAR